MYAVIQLPAFALQAVLRHEPELWNRSVALLDPTRNTPVVIEATRPARDSGVGNGLTATQATARSRDLILRRRSPAQEVVVTTALVQCLSGFSPHLEATSPGLFTLDLRNLAELRDASAETLSNWAGRLERAVHCLQLHPRIGLGGTPNIARLAACWGTLEALGSGAIQVITEPRSFVDSLPLIALSPSSDLIVILEKWGICSVGELLALGQEALADRLGLEALALIAASSTTATRPLKPVAPAEEFIETREFEEPIESVEPLLFVLRRFLDQLHRRLEPAGLVAEQLYLRMALETGTPFEQLLRVPAPTRDPDILFRMLHTFLEGIRTDAPITAVRLEVRPTLPRQRQFTLFETAVRDPNRFAETLACLVALVGTDRVGTPILEENHYPDAFQLVPPDFENAPAPPLQRSDDWLAAVPLRRLRPAQSVQVETKTESAGAPAPVPLSLRNRLGGGQLQQVYGPWKMSGRWWEPEAWEREEWDVLARDHQGLRLSRHPEGWFIEAVID